MVPLKKSRASIEYYYNYKPKANTPGIPMVRIRGNFMRGGFNISKNKVMAILDNLEVLKDFVSGEYDNDILALKENEKLKPKN